MTKSKIYLDISADGLDAIEQNSVNIGELLSNEGIVSELNTGFVTYESQHGARSKDPVSIIIASSAAIASIGFSISKVIAAISNKKQVIILDALEELRDKDNNLVFDKDGNPIYKTIKTIKIVDPATAGTNNYSLELFKAFRLQISSKS